MHAGAGGGQMDGRLGAGFYDPRMAFQTSTRPVPDREDSATRAGWWRTVLATIVGNLYLALGTVVCSSVAILSGPVSPGGRFPLVVARLWSRGLLATSGVKLVVEREADLDRHGCYVFMPNHQSLLDIPVLLCSLPCRSRFLAKKSLFDIPVFGWSLRASRFIPVDRDDRSGAREVFRQAGDRLRDGDAIVVFPEETRSPDGGLLPFQRGGFLLALKSGVPIVPVGIRGTGEMRRRGSFVVRPGQVEVRYGSPVDVRGQHLRDKKDLVSRIRREVGRLAGASETEEGARS